MINFNHLIPGRIPESLRNCVNKEFFVTTAPWSVIDQQAIHPELNGATYRWGEEWPDPSSPGVGVRGRKPSTGGNPVLSPPLIPGFCGANLNFGAGPRIGIPILKDPDFEPLCQDVIKYLVRVTGPVHESSCSGQAELFLTRSHGFIYISQVLLKSIKSS